MSITLMTPLYYPRRRSFIFLAATLVLPLLGFGPSARAEEFEAVAGTVSHDYKRKKQEDGRFVPESYAFAKGGYYSGPISDKTIDKMGFLQVAHIVADALRTKNYFPGFDPDKTKLLIVVYWGTTFAPEEATDSVVTQKATDRVGQIFAPGVDGNSGPYTNFSHPSLKQSNAELDALLPVQAENRMRDKQDALNAALLGYNSWWNQFGETDYAGTALEHEKQDMLTELEEDRYFVVLMAYDFQMLWKQKKHKLLWDTRFSIREHRNAFDERLPAMALQASRYFGQDSDGLKHDSLPEGHVEIGNLKNLGPLPEK